MGGVLYCGAHWQVLDCVAYATLPGKLVQCIFLLPQFTTALFDLYRKCVNFGWTHFIQQADDMKELTKLSGMAPNSSICSCFI